jgi:hypothetical protein
MRSTIYIDDPFRKRITQCQSREGKPPRRRVAKLLAQALAGPQRVPQCAPQFHWMARPLAARVDLGDKHALLEAMDLPSR